MFKLLYRIFMCAFILKNIQALNDEQKTNIQKKIIEFGEECIVEYPLSSDDIDYLKTHTFPDNENAGCFLACVFNKSGILDDEGQLSHTTVIENAKTIFDDEVELKNLADFISVCVNKVNNGDVTDKCDRAKLAYSCFAENSVQFGFNIDF